MSRPCPRDVVKQGVASGLLDSFISWGVLSNVSGRTAVGAKGTSGVARASQAT
jgi:hypothetical protein